MASYSATGVLNDVPGRSIPNRTRERIKAAAFALGYSPNPLVQSLRTKRARIVGVVLPDLVSSYHAQILSGVAHRLAEFNYCCMVLPYGYDSSLITKHVNSLMQRGAEGLIAIDTVLDHGHRELPTVAIGRQSHTVGTTEIQINQKRAAVLALEFFLSRGHRELLLLKKDPLDDCTGRLLRIVLETAAAYDLQVTAPSTGPSRMVEESTDVCVNSIDRFEAVLTLGAASARTANRAFSAARRRVSIVYIDNERNSILDESVTVVRQPLRTMGQMAAEILMQKIVSDRPLPELISVEPEIVTSGVRGNVGWSS